MHLGLELRHAGLHAELAVRRLDDPVNGAVHLPDRTHGTLSVDVDLAPGEKTVLAAGSLPDGRPVVLDVVVRR